MWNHQSMLPQLYVIVEQVVEYGESDSNSTYCGKMSTYHVSGTFSNFFSINQMCIG